MQQKIHQCGGKIFKKLYTFHIDIVLKLVNVSKVTQHVVWQFSY